jgi:indolepyruvate ferredoxin oxidoreductase
VYHLHPPLLRAWGLKKKLALGPWFRPALRGLAGLRRLRGGPLDVFGWTSLRRRERDLIQWYQGILRTSLAGLCEDNFEEALEIARSPDRIRGYEQVKLRSIEQVQREVQERMARFEQAATAAPALK